MDSIGRQREAAAYLQMLANEVRDGHVTAFKVEWMGGTEIKADVGLNKALEFIAVRLTVE